MGQIGAMHEEERRQQGVSTAAEFPATGAAQNQAS
jgi:hypothetical protein